LQRDHFVYGQSLLLESGVSGQLVRLLNNHFAGDGLYFERSRILRFGICKVKPRLMCKLACQRKCWGVMFAA